MHRSTKWIAFLVAAVMLAPLLVVPGGPAWAEPEAGDAVLDDEIIVLTSAGQIRVEDPSVPPGIQPATWNSGSDTGWTMVAAGDFNADGDAEIVAVRGNIIKVFDPVIQPNRPPVVFERTLDPGQYILLLATGDLDGDGRDEIIVNHVEGTLGQSSIRVYDGGNTATASEWFMVYQETHGAPWQDMATGDVNADGRDELLLVRKVDNRLLVYGYNLNSWLAQVANQAFSFPWEAVTTGDFSATYGGDEIALSRSEVVDYLKSLLFFRLTGTSFTDLVPGASYIYYPYFLSLAAGDVNGDGDDELLMLRDPVENKVSLLLVNPAGATVRTFQQAIGYGATAWKLVRAGDVDGDGRAEAVVLRGDRYRIYTEPASNDGFVDVTGSFYTSATTSNLPMMAVADVDGPGRTLGPTLAVSPKELAFNVKYAQPSPLRLVTITNSGTGSPIQWQAEAVEGISWLQFTPAQSATPSSLLVSVNSRAMLPGTYTGRIRVRALDPQVLNGTQDVTVSLTVEDTGFVVVPDQLVFWQAVGDPPMAQQVFIGLPGGSTPWAATALPAASAATLAAQLASGEAQVTAEGVVTADGVTVPPPSWLTFTPEQGTTPANMTVSTQLTTPGTYEAVILIVAQNPNVKNYVRYVGVTAHLVSKTARVYLPMLSR